MGVMMISENSVENFAESGLIKLDAFGRQPDQPG